MIVNYHDIQPDLQSKLAQYIYRAMHLFPAWLHYLEVYCEYREDSRDNTAACTMLTLEDCREAKLTVHPLFWGVSEERRYEFIRHEAIHVLTAPIVEWWEDQIEKMCGKSLTAMLKNEFSFYYETLVQDMAIASHSVVKFDWQNVPDEIKQTAEPHIKQWLHLIPRWVNNLYVRYDTEQQGDTICWISIKYDYRLATIFLCPRFLSRSNEQRAEDIRHEIVHLILAAMSDWAGDVLRKLIKDETARDILLSEWNSRVEQTTQDMAIALQNDTHVRPLGD